MLAGLPEASLATPLASHWPHPLCILHHTGHTHCFCSNMAAYSPEREKPVSRHAWLVSAQVRRHWKALGEVVMEVLTDGYASPGDRFTLNIKERFTKRSKTKRCNRSPMDRLTPSADHTQGLVRHCSRTHLPPCSSPARRSHKNPHVTRRRGQAAATIPCER